MRKSTRESGKKYIRVFYGNTRSLNKQKEEILRVLALNEDADIIAISEVGFIQGGQVELEGFEIIANQESDNTCNYWNGEVALWLRKSPELRVMNFSKTSEEGF